MTAGPWSLIGALAVTFGLIALAAGLLHRLRLGGVTGGGGPALQVLRRVGLGPKQTVALLRVGERVLVVSMSDHGTSLLTELSGADREAALGPKTADRKDASAWTAIWRRAVSSGSPMLPGRPAAPAAAASVPVETPAVPGKRPRRRRGRALGWAGLTALVLLAAPQASHAQMQSPAPTGVGAPVVRAPERGPIVQAPTPPKVEIRLGEGKDSLQLSGAVGLVVFLGFLTLLPALFLLMTSFTRILIVLHFLRSALGTQTTPPSQLLVAIAVLLTGVVMNPVLQRTNATAIQPYLSGQIGQVQAYQLAVQPFRQFMLVNTRTQDLAMFTELSHVSDAKSMDDVPIVTLVSAFVTSELRTAFQMGFAIFLPFIVVDVIVGSVLMSLGMFMLPPAMISLPFKLLLFVLADGWTLVVQNLVASFKAVS